MRILMVNQFFWPDIAPTGQYLCDLSRYLVAEGHEVTIICSGGSYANIAPDNQDAPPVRIIRVPGLAYKRGPIARLFSYSTFFAGALWNELRISRPDIVLTMTTPPLLSTAGAIMKALRGTRHFIWEMDLFPDAFVALGALRENAILTRVLGWIEDRARRHSDGVIVLGPCMRARLLTRGIPGRLVHVAENWADGSAISAGPNRTTGPLNIFYSGNLGLSHDLDTICGALRHFCADSRFLFTFAGGGVGRSQVERLCEAHRISNVRFLPYAGREEMNEHLAQADVGLVTERPACIGTVVPSKLYGLMAAARPILFIGPRRATPGIVINRFQCGWQIDPGDTPALIALLEWLAVRRDAAAVYGQRARAAFEKHYDRSHGVARVAAAMGLGARPVASTSPRRLVSAGETLRTV